jgi:hypothetical protein
VALEIFEADADIQTIVVPFRLYQRGWASVAGISVMMRVTILFLANSLTGTPSAVF